MFCNHQNTLKRVIVTFGPTDLVDQTIHVISKVNPLRLLMMKSSSLNGRLAKWAMLLSQYEMQFLPQRAMKGQAVADYLAKHPDSKITKLYEDLPDEVAKVCLTQTSFEGQVWQLFFDEASRTCPRKYRSMSGGSTCLPHRTM